MALLFADGFDHYFSSSELGRKWTATYGGGAFSTANQAVVESVGGVRARGGGRCYQSTQSNAGLLKTLDGNYATLIVGAAIYIGSGFPGAVVLLGVSDVNTTQVDVRGDGAGHLVCTRNGTTLATSTNVLATFSWAYIELKATIHNTTGAYEVRVNGAPWIGPTTNANTRATANAYANQAGGAAWTSGYPSFDDFYIADTSGSVGNDFFGPIKVSPLTLVGNGTYAEWTSSGGPNYLAAGEVVGDDDYTFNQSSTVNQRDSFLVGTPPVASGGTIYGIQQTTTLRQDLGSQRVMKNLVRTGGSDYLGAAFNTANSYQMMRTVHAVNPGTGSAWTPAEVAAAEFGYKLTT